MKINIIEEDEEKIILEWTDIICPHCNSKDVYVHTSYYDNVQLSSKKLLKFINKNVFLKKKRYICKDCKKTFFSKTVFSEGIFTEGIKPILKVLLDRDLIKKESIDCEVIKSLGLNNYEWVLINENKWIITLINKETCEIKEFKKTYSTKISTIYQNNKEWKREEKFIEYIPFDRKIKDRIK